MSNNNINDASKHQREMKNRIKELEKKIQEEIWRIQMIDYPTLNTNNELHKMQKELKELKANDA